MLLGAELRSVWRRSPSNGRGWKGSTWNMFPIILLSQQLPKISGSKTHQRAIRRTGLRFGRTASCSDHPEYPKHLRGPSKRAQRAGSQGADSLDPTEGPKARCGPGAPSAARVLP